MADDDGRTKCVLPPSPNWYCSSAADCSLDGAYAFVAKKRVYVLDVSGETPCFKGQFTEHSDRTSSAVFCPHEGYFNFCVSGADDKTVKIWDIETKIVTASHNIHQAKITCICWSGVAYDLIFSADEKGTIIAWRHIQNIVYSACPVQEYIFCISASCQSEKHAAVGYKNGLIAVLHLDDNLGITVTHRLRGHDGDVHSIAWCPVPIEQLDLGPLQKKADACQGNLIISGSRDQTIRLWDTVEGKLISIFNLPKRSSQKWRDKHDWQSKDRLWLAVCWPTSLKNKIISSSHSGELLQWDLSVAGGTEQVQRFGQGHSRIVFNISCNKEGTKVISYSMDRQIIVWDLQSRCILHSISTLGGFVYALDVSPLDPGTVAVGVGDSMIRLWNTASSVSAYDSFTLWQGIKSKVQMVSWHPHKEGLLAFGTEDGQVGIYNTVSKKPEVFAAYHKKTVYSVSWGPPCPAIEDKDESECHLYSCAGDGSVLEHRPGRPMQDAIDVNAMIKSTNNFKHKLMCRTDVAWNRTGTAMALGNDDGTIEVFTPPSLRWVCTISVHKKIITCLAWHHGYGDDSAEGEEKYKFWLASGSNESTIHIHDLSNVLCTNSENSLSSTAAPITSSHRKLVGHSGRTTAMSWSPHHCNMLVSGSYDGTAQVWDVEKSQPVANYRDHVGRVMSVKWSFLDPDVIYSGGEDGTVQPWRVSMQDHTHPPVNEKQSSHGESRSSKNKKKSKSKAKEKTSLKENAPVASKSADDKQDYGMAAVMQSFKEFDSEEKAGVESQKQDYQTTELLSWRKPIDSATTGHFIQQAAERLVSPVDQVFDQVNSDLFDAESIGFDDGDDASLYTTQESGPTVVISKSRSDAAKKKKKVKSLFPLSAVADNKSKASSQQECIALAQYVYDKQGDAVTTPVHSDPVVPGEPCHVNLGFFADRRSAYRMIATEGKHHSSANNLDYQLQLEVWKGNLGGALQMATKAKQLTDWLVALSPLAGHDVWLNTAESFADQLASYGAHQRAVLYYLSCHKIYRAIDVYQNQSMFREAIGLAKVRLSPSDPVLSNLYCSWARKLETENSYEQAAKCYIAADLPAEAARILSTRGDQSSLTTALQVSVISGQDQLASSLAVRVLHICLETGNWIAGHKALTLCTGVEGHLFALCVHELLVEELVQEGNIQDDDFKDKVHSDVFSGEVNTDNTKLNSLLDILERKRVSSPWLLDTPTRDWFIRRVLEAWVGVGAFTTQRSVLERAIQQLLAYCQSNLSENLSLKQVLTRISYDISLGLLRGITQDIYSCSLPWLQALDTCCKSSFLGFFFLPQILCVLLLPQGVQSLKDISSIGKTLMEPEEEQHSSTPTVQTSADDIFSYFDSFYNLMLLFKFWWKDPSVLDRLFRRVVNFNQERFLQSDIVCTEHQHDKTTSVSPKDIHQHHLKGDAPLAVGNKLESNADVANSTQLCQKSDKLSEAKETSKESLPSCTLKHEFPSNDPIKDPLNLPSVIAHIRDVLLHKDRAVCSALKEQLLEVKKQVILLRSRRILDSVVVNKAPAKKKSSSKKKETVQLAPKDVAEIQDSKSYGIGKNDKKKNGTPTPKARENETETLKEVLEHWDSSCARMIDNDDKIDDESTTDQSYCDVQGSTAQLGPLDIRYKGKGWTLELMQSEEQRLLEELSKYPLKDLPIPNPTEAALVIGHLCSHVIELPCHEPAVLYQLGLEAVGSGLEHAQWEQELKCLKRMKTRLTEMAAEI